MIKKKMDIPFESSSEKDFTEYSKLEQWIIGIACLGIFPLIYLIGKWIMSIL